MSNFDESNIDLSRFAPIYQKLVNTGAIAPHYVTETNSGYVVSATPARRGGVEGLDKKEYATISASDQYFPFSHINQAAEVIKDIAKYLYDPSTDPAKRQNEFADFNEFYAPLPAKAVEAMKKVTTIANNEVWSVDPWRHNPEILGHWEHSTLRSNFNIAGQKVTDLTIDVSVSSAGVVSIDRNPHYLGMIVSIDTPKLIRHVLEEKITRIESMAEADRLYGYSINSDERGFFSADVRNRHGHTLFEIQISPDDEDNIFTDGFMKNKNDLQGLGEYLKSMNIIQPTAVILPLNEFEKKQDDIAKEILPKISRRDTVVINQNNENSLHVVGNVDKSDKTFLSLTDGKTYSLSSLASVVSSPELQRSVNSSTMDRTEHTIVMRSKSTFGTDNEKISLYADEDIREIAERKATGYGAVVVSVDGVDYSEIKKQKHYLSIQIDNTKTAAFQDIGEDDEVKRILNYAANTIRSAKNLSDVDGLALTDTNGNPVGRVAMTDASFELAPGNIRIELAITGFNTPDRIAPFVDAAVDGIMEGKTEFHVVDGVPSNSQKDLITRNDTLKVVQVFVVPDPEKSMRSEMLSDMELPGAWSNTDLIGGKTDMEP